MNEIVRAIFEILINFDPKRIFTTIYNNLQQFTTIFEARVDKNRAGSNFFEKNIINITICRSLPIFTSLGRLELPLCFRKCRPGEIRLRSWLQEAPRSRFRLNSTIFRLTRRVRSTLGQVFRTCYFQVGACYNVCA